MKKAFSLFLFLSLTCTGVLATNAYAKNDSEQITDTLMLDHKVTELGDKYIALLSLIYSEEATRVGTMGYHSKLEVRDQQSEIQKRQTMLSLKKALENINVKELSPQKKIDYYILTELVNEKLFKIDTESELSKDPLFYMAAVGSIYDILMKDFMPASDRLRDALKRLELLPAIFQEAQRNLDNPPDIKIRLAMEKANLAYNSFGAITFMLNKLSSDDYAKEQIKTASEAARKSIKDYFEFLKAMMLSKDYVDFRLGTAEYTKLMKNVYSVDIVLPKLQKTLDKELEVSTENLIFALTPIIEPAFTEEERAKRTNKKGLIEITPADYYIAAATFTKHPAYKDILEQYATNFKEATTFFADKKAFPVGALQVVIAPAPKYFESKYEDVTYLPPFPLINRQMGDVLVSLPSEKDAKEVLPKLFTYSNIKLSTMENITPGKNLMYSITASEGLLLRKLSNDLFYTNGWIKYAVNMAKETGFLSTDEDNLNLAWYNYKKAVLALADLKMQTKELNYTQTLDYVMDSGLSKEEAEADVDNLAIRPLSGVSAIVGEQEFMRLKNKYQKKFGKKFDMADFHKKVLTIGRVPLFLLDDAIAKSYEKKEVESFFNMTYF